MNLDELKLKCREFADSIAVVIDDTLSQMPFGLFDSEEIFLREMRRRILDNIEFINNYQKSLTIIAACEETK